MNPYHGSLFIACLDNRLCPQFNGKFERTHVDGVNPELSAKIRNAYAQFFPKTVDRANPQEMLQGAIGFSTKLGHELPFLEYDNYGEYLAAGDQFNESKHARYLERCLLPRNVLNASAGKNMDCVVHALAIAYVIGQEGWSIYHAYCDSDKATKSRHTLVARPVGDAFVLLDPTRAISRRETLAKYLLQTKAEFHKAFFEPSIEWPIQKAV